MKNLSRVIIVGQPNVGKSVLFNRLTHSNQAITSHVAHTTRDQNRGVVKHNGVQFELVDSAGFAKPTDELNKLAILQIQDAVNMSDLVVFVADGTTQLNSDDLKLAKLVIKSKLPVILLINKLDKKEFNSDFSYYRKLGFENIMQASAQNGQGINDLLNEVVIKIPRKKAAQIKESIKIAILGRPNVGKSALINALANEEVALVSDIAGTTRDVNLAEAKYKDTILDFFDTAGLRRRGKISKGIEFFSGTRTKSAIERADVCLVLIDGTEGLTKQDEHIIGMVKDARKALIVAVTKWDAIEDKEDNTMAEMGNIISHNLQYVWWAPLIFTSSVEKQNLEKLKQIIVEVNSRRATKIPTKELNDVLKTAVQKQPPVTTRGFHAKMNYVTQTGNDPIEFSVFGTHPELIHFSYMRYIENQLRQNFELTGVPIKLVFKSKYKEDKV
jgi:GTP-binding protein